MAWKNIFLMNYLSTKAIDTGELTYSQTHAVVGVAIQ